MIACIVAANEASYIGLSGLGMVPITKFPRWLEYEHRTWFPKLDETIRAIEKEAQYLWLPQEAARNFVERMIPIADGKKLISRRKRKEPGIIGHLEKYSLEAG